MYATIRAKIPAIALCLWCLALLAVRMRYADTTLYGFMVWNLFLAVVPVIAAASFRQLSSVRGWSLAKGSLLVIWLAFLPNAPYLVTDLIHLQSRPPVPLWYDVIMLGSFAATGVFLTYLSVADVEAVVRDRFGHLAASAVAYGSLAICGFGIYLGRFMRWNSWDIVASPLSLLADVAHRFTDPMSHTRTWAVTVLYGAALVLGYMVLKSAATPLAAVPNRRERPRR